MAGKEKDNSEQTFKNDEEFRERVDFYLGKFDGILEEFEKDHPKWGWEVTYWLLDQALTSLRHYIEDESEQEISWESPFVELQFPVDCSWDESDPENPTFFFTTGTLSEKDVSSKKKAAKALSKLLVKHLEIETLQGMTNHAALEKRGDTYRRILPAEMIEALMQITDEEEREREADLLFQPKSFGAGSIDYGELKEGEVVSPEIHEQLQSIEEPLFALPCEIGGEPIRIIAVFEVHPLVYEPEERRAYFSIVAGLAIQSNSEEPVTIDRLSEPWTNFANWNEDDRNEVWGLIDEYLKETLKILEEEPELEEAVVSVSADIRVTVPRGDKKAVQQIQQEMLRSLQESGEVLALELNQRSNTSTDAAKIHSLLKSVEEAATNHEKGASLENLMSALFDSIPGFSVLPNAITQTEEIDLWVENNIEEGPFRKEGDIVLVECKNWSGKCGKNEFVVLKDKALNRGQRCTLAFLVSWRGFSETITKELLRGSRENLLIVPLDGQQITEAAQAGDFLLMLKTARSRALMI